jgi:shikimate kinase
VSGRDASAGRVEAAAELRRLGQEIALGKTVALVGLMGAGKTTVGRRLAQALGCGFTDADAEIVAAAGCSVAEIFAERGEAEFRRGERQVIARLLSGAPHVLATGGGAFMDAGTRALLKEKAISVWLKAPIEVLLKRVMRRDTRPLLQQGDPHEVMARLMAERYPIYAEADIVIETGGGPHRSAVTDILAALKAHPGTT